VHPILLALFGIVGLALLIWLGWQIARRKHATTAILAAGWFVAWPAICAFEIWGREGVAMPGAITAFLISALPAALLAAFVFMRFR
jgi:hypothetical protein